MHLNIDLHTQFSDTHTHAFNAYKRCNKEIQRILYFSKVDGLGHLLPHCVVAG